MLAHEQSREAQACPYVFMLKAGILLQNLLLAIAGREEIQDGLRGDSFPAQGRFAVAYRGIDGDASVQKGKRGRLGHGIHLW